jgi:hypothetical protein
MDSETTNVTKSEALVFNKEELRADFEEIQFDISVLLKLLDEDKLDDLYNYIDGTVCDLETLAEKCRDMIYPHSS